MQENELERIQRIHAEVEESLARGKRPDLAGYFLRFPELEEQLRGHFRRMGLLSDPFRDAGHFRRETPPWETASVPKEDAPLSPSPSTPARTLERELLLENLLRPAARGDRRSFLKRRSRTILALAAAFVLGWAALMVREEFSPRSSLQGSVRARIDGLAALLALAADRPGSKGDLLLAGAAEADRSIRDEGDRWQLRWLRFLFLQGLGSEKEAARDLDSLPPAIARQLLFLDRPAGRAGGAESEEVGVLAAMGDVLAKGPERSKDLLAGSVSPELKLLSGIVRGAAFPASRREIWRLLIDSTDPHVRLLGSAWGIGAGDPSAREVLRELPIESVATAGMLVALGEEEAFLRRSRPGRIDLAPLRIQVLRKLGRSDEARRFTGEILALNPDSFELRLEAARLFREEKDFERAAANLRVATLLRAGSAEPMRELLRLASDCPDRPDLIAPFADLFLRRLSEETRRLLSRSEGAAAPGSAPGDGGGSAEGPERLLVPCGFALPREEEARSGAIAALTRAAASRTGGAATLFLLGRSLFATGRWGEAAERLEAAERAADPLDRPALRPWIDAAKRRAGRTEEADAGGRMGSAGPGAAVPAAWDSPMDGEPVQATAALSGEGAGDGAEDLLMEALLAAGDDPAAAEVSLGEAALRSPADPRPWFLRGYFRDLRGDQDAADADWDEFLRLAAVAGPAQEGRGGFTVLEEEALPWEIALVHASRGDLAAARGFASLGPCSGRTPLGAFFRAAALAAASEWSEAEAEALAYRDRSFPLFAWQGGDRWAGALFR